MTQLFWCHVDSPEWRESSSIGPTSILWRRFTLTICEGQLFFIGGHTTFRIPSRQVYSFRIEVSADGKEIVNHPWTELRSMKTARGGHTATALPYGRIAVTGGLVSPNVMTNITEVKSSFIFGFFLPPARSMTSQQISGKVVNVEVQLKI